MKTDIVVTVLAVLGTVSAHPQGVAKTPAPLILQQAAGVNDDGSFQYSYETENGIHVAASGNQNAARNIQGSYSYTSPDGTPITTTYVADGTGFKPQGDHLPKAPEVPAALTRAWAYHAAKARAKASKEAPSQQMALQPGLVPPPVTSPAEAPKNSTGEAIGVFTDAPKIPAHLAEAWANYAELVKTEGSRPSQEGEPSSDLVPPAAISPADYSNTIKSPESQNSGVPAHFLMAWEQHLVNGVSQGSADATLPREPYVDLVPPPDTSLDGSAGAVVDVKGAGDEGDDLPVDPSVPAHFARAWAAFASSARIEEPEVASSQAQVMLAEPLRDLVPPSEGV